MCIHVIFWWLTLLDDVLCKTRLYVDVCIDLHVMYVFLYLYVMDLKLESRYDMCYIFSHCIYFYIYLYCPIEQSIAINT